MKTKYNLSESEKTGRNGAQLVYVLDCIKNSTRAYDEGRTFATDADALRFFFECFDSEFNCPYNKKRFPSLAERIGDWLRGLPSCCCVAYSNYDILSLGIAWGVLDSTEGPKAGRFLENYWRVLGLRIIEAAENVGLNLSILKLSSF